MRKAIPLLVLPLLAIAFITGGCGNSSTATDQADALVLERTVALVALLKEQVDTEYALGAEVWNGQTPVITLEVEDPTSDYRSEVKKFTTAKAVREFEGALRIVFLKHQPLSEEDKANDLKNNILILGDFDAKTGEPR